jgi:hypothetical protein
MSPHATQLLPVASTPRPSSRRPKHARPPGAPLAISACATGRLAARVAAGILAATAVVAAAIRLLAADPTRRWLDYPFAGIAARPGEAAAILLHNGRALLGVFGLLLIAQLALRTGDGPRRSHRALRAGGETLLTGLVLANVLVVGASLGAYGTRMAAAMLPHGPVELAAFALALTLYLQGRRRSLPTRHMLATGTASLLLLAAAAALETFVTP